MYAQDHPADSNGEWVAAGFCTDQRPETVKYTGGAAWGSTQIRKTCGWCGANCTDSLFNCSSYLSMGDNPMGWCADGDEEHFSFMVSAYLSWSTASFGSHKLWPAG
jgi:hypothetical protein